MIIETKKLKRILQGKIMHLDEKERHAIGAGKPDLAAVYANNRAGIFTALKVVEAQETKTNELNNVNAWDGYTEQDYRDDVEHQQNIMDKGD